MELKDYEIEVRKEYKVRCDIQTDNEDTGLVKHTIHFRYDDLNNLNVLNESYIVMNFCYNNVPFQQMDATCIGATLKANGVVIDRVSSKLSNLIKLNYDNTGFEYLQGTIKHEHSANLPLDTIFPFVKNFKGRMTVGIMFEVTIVITTEMKINFNDVFMNFIQSVPTLESRNVMNFVLSRDEPFKTIVQYDEQYISVSLSKNESSVEIK